MALGAAVENALIGASAAGLGSELEPFPFGEGSDVVAAIALERDGGRALAPLSELSPLVGRRCTDRRLGPRTRLAPERLRAMVATTRAAGAELQLATEPAGLAELGRIIGVSDRIRILCRVTHEELVSELRWSDAEAERTRDGVTVTSVAQTPLAQAAITLVTRPDVARFLHEIGGGARLEEEAWKAMASASGAGLLTATGTDSASWLTAGRALQRMWLQATGLGIAIQPLTVVLYQIEMLAGDGAAAYTDRQADELSDLDRRLFSVFERPAAGAAMLFRLASLTGEPERSLRLPASAVLTAGAPPG